MEACNRVIQFLLRRAGNTYTAGPDVQHALKVCKNLAVEGLSSTICYWNTSPESPYVVFDRYIQALQLIRELPSDSYMSVKAPALGFDSGLLKEILYQAKSTNTPIHFDSMAPETVDRTFALIEDARRIYSQIGCTLPARWRRSLKDVDRVTDLGLSVRLVKGQWAEMSGNEVNSGEGFLHLIDRLSSKCARLVAVATHNAPVAHASLARLKSRGISCELELLHRMPRRRMLKLAQQHGVTTRVYVPYGHAGLPYRLREIGRDPRILAWFISDLIRA